MSAYRNLRAGLAAGEGTIGQVAFCMAAIHRVLIGLRRFPVMMHGDFAHSRGAARSSSAEQIGGAEGGIEEGKRKGATECGQSPGYAVVSKVHKLKYGDYS